MTIIEKLRKFGETHNLSAIATQAKMSPQTLHGYLHQDRVPRADIALRLAKVLCVDPMWLLDESTEWPPVWRNHEEAANAQAVA